MAALWDSGCLGVQVTASGRRVLTLDAYYPGAARARRVASRLRPALLALGLPRRFSPRMSLVKPESWVEIWQRSLKPMVVGPFLILPEGRIEPAGSKRRHVLRVRYGQAFGTGEHASTRLCLRALVRHLSSGDAVADLGTGTAILAMAACRLGAGRVLAVDNDPTALEVARLNLKENGLDRRVVLQVADAAQALVHGPFDLALVNIGATTIGSILQDLAPALASGGRAILAGFLIEDEESLLAAASAHGLRLIDRHRSRPWSALVLSRLGSSRRRNPS